MSIWVLIHRVSAAVIILVALVWAWSLIYPQYKQSRDLTARQRALEEEIQRDEETLRHLRMKQQRLLNDPRFVEKIAREELGLARPGETIFRFADDPSPLAPRTNTTTRIQR